MSHSDTGGTAPQSSASQDFSSGDLAHTDAHGKVEPTTGLESAAGPSPEISDDLVASALGQLGRDGAGAASLEDGAAQTHLAADLCDHVADASHPLVPADAGGELLGILLEGADGHGAYAGFVSDVGHALDMLTSTVDLFEVPAVDAALDHSLPT